MATSEFSLFSLYLLSLIFSCLQGRTHSLQGREESGQLVWIKRAPPVSQSGSEHFRRASQRDCPRVVPFQQCPKPPKVSTGCNISSEDAQTCAPLLFSFVWSSDSILHADLKAGWTPCPNGPCMHDGKLPTGESQSFYFPPNHEKSSSFKRMEVIIHKHGL
jgi:hypothetical protein